MKKFVLIIGSVLLTLACSGGDKFSEFEVPTNDPNNLQGRACNADLRACATSTCSSGTQFCEGGTWGACMCETTSGDGDGDGMSTGGNGPVSGVGGSGVVDSCDEPLWDSTIDTTEQISIVYSNGVDGFNSSTITDKFTTNDSLCDKRCVNVCDVTTHSPPDENLPTIEVKMGCTPNKIVVVCIGFEAPIFNLINCETTSINENPYTSTYPDPITNKQYSAWFCSSNSQNTLNPTSNPPFEKAE